MEGMLLVTLFRTFAVKRAARVEWFLFVGGPERVVSFTMHGMARKTDYVSVIGN